VKFLFIGASGFVGHYAMELARASGHDVLGTQSRPQRPGLLKYDLLADRLGDCLPREWIQEPGLKYGVVSASVRQIDQCYREREMTRRINVDGTLTAIRDLRDMGIRPVFLSTSYVFDGRRGYYTEQDARAPVCEYGRHKAEVEEKLLADFPDVLILRLDKIVGDDPRDDHLFSEWWRWLEAGQPLTCIAGQILSPTFVTDIGRAILLACAAGLTGLYNTANSEFFSREELAAQFLAICGRRAEIQCRPLDSFKFLDPRPMKTYLDSALFGATTDMRFTPMREVMVRFVERARKR